MAVEMNKYVHPKDGSIVVMAASAEKVETKHGVFKKVADQKADNVTAKIVPASALTAATGSPVNKVVDPQSPVSPMPTTVLTAAK